MHQDTNKTEILDVQTGKYSTERTEASTGILENEFILYVKEKLVFQIQLTMNKA